MGLITRFSDTRTIYFSKINDNNDNDSDINEENDTECKN